MPESETRDPAQMTYGEVASKLWEITHREPLDRNSLLLWMGVAMAKLMQAQRMLDR